MTTATATGTSGTGSTSGTTVAESRTKLNANFETFIKLLTTQLQNQDPLQPMDTNQFTQQLVQYSQVEQQLSTNDKLDSLISLQQGQGVQAALGYLGWEVSAGTKDLPLQNGHGVFSVTTASAPSSVSIGIADSTGKIVRGITLTGEQFTQNGKLTQDVVWDGMDNNGNQLADGNYSVVLTALDSNGSSIKTTVATRGTVTGVDVDDDGNTVLKIGTLKISPSSVTSIGAPTTFDTSTAS